MYYRDMHKHIRNTSQALALVLLFASSTASAVVWVGGGVEYITWGEYDDYAVSGTVFERDWARVTGFMPYVEANADIPLTERTRLNLAGRAYGGDIDYESRSAAPNFTTTEERRGVKGEAGIIFRPLPSGEYKETGFVANVGLESFSRNYPAADVKQTWTVPFVRLGAVQEAPDTGGWSGRGGLIIPVEPSVEASASGVSVTAHPETTPTFYLGFGRRFSRFFEVGFDYDGLRFSDSNDYPLRVETDSYRIYVKAGF
jgi:hypothetical protein